MNGTADTMTDYGIWHGRTWENQLCAKGILMAAGVLWQRTSLCQMGGTGGRPVGSRYQTRRRTASLPGSAAALGLMPPAL